jgi:hypothetical protein
VGAAVSDPVKKGETPQISTSLRRPAPVDRKICAGNRLGRIRAKINGKVGDLVDSDEFLCRLCRQQYVALDLFFR